MTITEIVQQFVAGIRQTTWYEYLAVVSGILSVWYSRRENILVYPVGLVNTLIYIYISLEGHLPGEAAVNTYYTIMSVVGWILWYRKGPGEQPLLHISSSSAKEWKQQLLFFLCCYTVIFFSLRYFKQAFFEGAIPWADAFASATAFTGMWLMTRKKVESWYWWILTNIASIPLYFVKHYVVSSLYYFILLLLAINGLMAWQRKASRTSLDYSNPTA